MNFETSTPLLFHNLALTLITMPSLDDKNIHLHLEHKCPEDAEEPDEILALFPILQDMSHQDLDRLNRSVLRKLDWQFLLCVSIMLLMK